MPRPLVHPVTGRPLNVRSLKRRLQHDFIDPWMPASGIASGVPAADVLVPPWLTATVTAGSGGSSTLLRQLSAYEGFLRMATSTDAGATATVGIARQVHLAPAGGVRSPRIGLHAWLRYGDNASLSVTTGATIGFCFDNSATAPTSGFKIEQAPGASYASLVVHGDATYLMDGSGGLAGSATAVDLRSHRPAMVGIEFDPRDNEVFVVFVTPDGTKQVLWRRVISAVNKTNAVGPRIVVTNLSATQQQLNLYRLDYEVWT